MEQELKAAAAEFVDAPRRLHAAILRAAASGEKPARITRTIGHVYTADYVARIVRDARKAGKIPAAAPSD